MVRGNILIQEHETQQRSIELFVRLAKTFRYEGTFRLVDNYEADAPELEHGSLRTVLVFRLEPIDALEPETRSVRPAIPTQLAVERLQSYSHESETDLQFSRGKLPAAVRRASGLVQTYGSFLRRQGAQPVPLRTQPPGEVGPMIADLYEPDENLLVVAKGSTSREAIRLGIGQLLDNRRFTEPPARLALLLPHPPRPDLLALLHSVDVTAIVPDGGSDYREIGPS